MDGWLAGTGVAAATYPVYQATSTRVRDLPITPDKLIHNPAGGTEE